MQLSRNQSSRRCSRRIPIGGAGFTDQPAPSISPASRLVRIPVSPAPPFHDEADAVRDLLARENSGLYPRQTLVIACLWTGAIAFCLGLFAMLPWLRS